MQSLPPSTATPAIYLMSGVLPAVAERDIQIMRLVGQLAICSRDLQNVSAIVEQNLSKYDVKFPGWSGVARRTAALYGLPDPLELFQQPWVSKRFGDFAKETISKYWASYLQESAQTYEENSLRLFDSSRLTLTSPHPIWLAAGSNSISVQRATVVSWLLLGVYKTMERLHTMNKVSSPTCLLCEEGDLVEDQLHFALFCTAFSEIRNFYFKKIIDLNHRLNDIRDDHQMFLISLLDPFSPKLPEELRNEWKNADEVYELSRNYFAAIHKKREGLMEKYEKEIGAKEADEPSTNIVISLYSQTNTS